MIGNTLEWFDLSIYAYFATRLNISQSSGFLATLTGGLILTFVTPIVGYLSGHIGRLKIMLTAAVLYAVAILPAFLWLNSRPSSLLLVVALMALIKAVYFAPLPSLMADIFPVRTRVTGMSLSYNLGGHDLRRFRPGDRHRPDCPERLATGTEFLPDAGGLPECQCDSDGGEKTQVAVR